MIQFNLLPNVKLEYVKTQRTKRLLTGVSIIASLVAIAVLLVSFLTVNVVQRKSLNDLNGDITTYSKQLNDIKDLDKILTVQNQLSTLTSLHDQKPVGARLFPYIAQVTPAQASLNQLALDFTASTITVGGTAPSLDVVSTFTNTLKATTFKLKGDEDAKHAFTDVVLTTFARSQAGATFTITCSFKPEIFNTANEVDLKVPQTAGADLSGVFEGDE